MIIYTGTYEEVDGSFEEIVLIPVGDGFIETRIRFS